MTERLRPDILGLTPTALEAWARCRREYRNAQLLGIAASDSVSAPDTGSLVHDVLRLVHRSGSCRDSDNVTDVLLTHDIEGPGPLRDFIERHARRCPDATAIGHEIDVARFHRFPAPMFMGTARLDAVWVHDGVLDVRDYKTGVPRVERVADDPRARLQAWIAAPRAVARDLRLQVRYEHLAPTVDEDPEPFEPADDDLAAIEEELRGTAAAVWQEQDFAGIADPEVCRWCRYRSICPDSAVPGVPIWTLPPEPADSRG